VRLATNTTTDRLPELTACSPATRTDRHQLLIELLRVLLYWRDGCRVGSPTAVSQNVVDSPLSSQYNRGT